uniref:Heat shock factor-binding protein 1 n=1 Tax=Syphacia muris TaxID=451379 RepID=A0A0N5AMZ1_9BILA
MEKPVDTDKQQPVEAKPEINGNINEDLSVMVQTVLQSTQDRFQMLSDQILHRIDEMSKRLDELQKNVMDLMEQAGVEAEP